MKIVECNIKSIWNALDQGKTIHWSNESYKVYVEPVNPDSTYQINHFSRRGNELLSVRCISNYFGSVINETDLGSLFIKK